MRGRFSGVIESEREGWESGRRLPGVVQDGLTGGAEGWTWHQVSARVTRIGCSSGPSACGVRTVREWVTWQGIDAAEVDRGQQCGGTADRPPYNGGLSATTLISRLAQEF